MTRYEILLLLFSLVVIQLSPAQTNEECEILSDSNFETGLGDWLEVGPSASLSTDPANANSGQNALLIQNDGPGSTATSPSFDLTRFATLEIQFSFMTLSFEPEEDFWLQYSIDDGVTFKTIQEWKVGQNFENGIYYQETVQLMGPFSAAVKIRFRSDASANEDFLFLDDISIVTCKAVGENLFPIANFTVNTTVGTPPLDITFDASTSSDLNGDYLTYLWDFGNGDQSKGRLTAYTFEAIGTYTVTLTVSDGQATDVLVKTIEVKPDGEECEPLDAQDFEEGTGIWELGPLASRVNNPNFDYSDNYCARIINDGELSQMTTNFIDWSEAEELQVYFSYQTNSFEGEEDFWLQISRNGSDNFSTVRTFQRGEDFQNDITYNAFVRIRGPFSENTRLRFRCDASADTDFLYLDNILIFSCLEEDNDISNDGLAIAPGQDLATILLSPNPVKSQVNINYMHPEEGPLNLSVFNSQGQKMQTLIQANKHPAGQFSLDLSTNDWPKGMYFMRYIQGEKVVTKPFFKS